jgi:Leucine-rich repeat (LRR) protein
MSEEIPKILELLTSNDVGFVRQGLELLDMLIDDPQVMAAFANQKVCLISPQGIPTTSDGFEGTMKVDAVIGITKILASRGDASALATKKIDVSKEQNTIFPDDMDVLVNLEEITLGQNRGLKVIPDWMHNLPKLKKVSFIRSGIQLPPPEEYANLSEVLQIAIFEKLISTSVHGNDKLIPAYAKIQPKILEPFHFTVLPAKFGFAVDCSEKPYGLNNVRWTYQETLFWMLAGVGKVKFEEITKVSGKSSLVTNIDKMTNLLTLDISVDASHQTIFVPSLDSLESVKISGNPVHITLSEKMKSFTVDNWDLSKLESITVSGKEYSDLALALSNCTVEKIVLQRLKNFNPPGIEVVRQYSATVKQAFLRWSMSRGMYEGSKSSNIEVALQLFDAFPEELLKPYFGTFSVPNQDRQTAFGCRIKFTAPKDFLLPKVYSKHLIDQMFARLIAHGDPVALAVNKVHCIANDLQLYGGNPNLKTMYVEAKNDIIDVEKTTITSIKIKGIRIKDKRPNYTVYYRPTLQGLKLPPQITDVSVESVYSNVDFLEQIPADITSLNISNIKWKKIPDLSRFTKLETLKVINCGLKKVRNLPPTLKTLYISSNPLPQLPAAIFECAQLEKLWISNMGLTEIPEAICRLQNLKVLVSCKNNITEGTDYLAELPNLEELRIGSKKMWGTKNQFPILNKVPPSLKKLSLYERVALNSEAFADVELETLDIQDCPDEFAYRAIRSVKRVDQLVGYAPQKTFFNRGEEQPDKIDEETYLHPEKRKKTRVSYHYSSGGRYSGTMNVNAEFKKGLEKRNRLLKK